MPRRTLKHALLFSFLLVPAWGQTQTHSTPPRSRWSISLPLGITIWKLVGGTSIWPWQQPAVNEQLALSYRFLGPTAPYELRGALLAGQRLDQPGNALGGMVAIAFLPRPFSFGLGVILLHRFNASTDFGVAGSFGIGAPVGSGIVVGFGGQVAFYPLAPGQPLTLVLGPSVSYRFP